MKYTSQTYWNHTASVTALEVAVAAVVVVVVVVVVVIAFAFAFAFAVVVAVAVVIDFPALFYFILIFHQSMYTCADASFDKDFYQYVVAWTESWLHTLDSWPVYCQEGVCL